MMMSTTPTTMLLLGHAIVALVLLSRLSALDELSLALTCRFALDIFTVIQQDYPEAFEELTVLDLELEEVACALQAAAYHIVRKVTSLDGASLLRPP